MCECVSGEGGEFVACEPGAGLEEVFVEAMHGEVDDGAVCVADEATEAVASDVEGEGGVVVVVERAESLVVRDLEAESLGDLFDGEIAEG